MLDPKKARPWNGDGKPATELTSTQLVIGTCIFLVAALICFALGFVLGRYEERAASGRTATAQAVPSAPLPPPPRTEAAPPPPQQPEGGNQVSPRRVVMPPPSQSQTPGYPSSTGAGDTAPKVSEHPAPPKAEESAPAQAATPPPAAEPPPAQPEQPPAAPVPAQAPAPAASTPAAPAVPAAPTSPTGLTSPTGQTAPTPAPAPATPPAVPAADGKSPYAIQVASLTGPARKERALEFQRRLESNAGIKAELVTTEDGKTIRVLVGGYPDRESATKACEDLKKRQGFKDCFVKRR